MKVVSRLNISNKTIITLDGDVLNVNEEKAIINGKNYPYTIAYDMENTIGIDAQLGEFTEVEFA